MNEGLLLVVLFLMLINSAWNLFVCLVGGSLLYAEIQRWRNRPAEHEGTGVYRQIRDSNGNVVGLERVTGEKEFDPSTESRGLDEWLANMHLTKSF